jgi:hypothetical protein
MQRYEISEDATMIPSSRGAWLRWDEFVAVRDEYESLMKAIIGCKLLQGLAEEKE